MAIRLATCLVVLHLVLAASAASGASAASAAEPTRFCITADNRGATGYMTVLKSLASVPGGPGAFLISNGDQDPARVTRNQIDAVLGPALPWYPVVGNHEVSKLLSLRATSEIQYLRDHYIAHLAGKVNPGPEGTRETTYSFNAGDVHIAILNEYWNGGTQPESDRKGGGQVIAPLREWLKKDLQGSHKPWKLVVGHPPAFPQPDRDWGTGRHNIDVAAALNVSREQVVRNPFWMMLEAQGVAAYLCAHTHLYSRFQPPGSKVWQIDAAQARSNKDWKYDAFIIVTADAQSLKFEIYRNLEEQGKFTITDHLTLTAAGAAGSPAAGQPGLRPPN